MSARDRAAQLALLVEESAKLERAADRLGWSMLRSQLLASKESWSAEELERLESLASRFARQADLLTQRVLRLADDLELEAPGSLLDRIRRAEKRGWVTHDGDLVRVRELRNLIAHEYEDEDLASLYREVMRLSPVLLDAIPRVLAWARQVR